MTAIENSTFVFVQPFVSKFIAPVCVPASYVFASPMVVIARRGVELFPSMQSSIYDRFVRSLATNLGGTLRFAPTDCFEPFPFPMSSPALTSIGSNYHEFRHQIMQTRQEGLTKTYNRFHDRGEQSADIARLRALHVEMDQAVAAAYGWSDLDLGHGFHATKQGERYTLSEPARRTVLDRLLTLNHQRYEEEVAAGLHDKKGKAKKAKLSRGKRGRKSNADAASGPIQATLFPDPQGKLF